MPKSDPRPSIRHNGLPPKNTHKSIRLPYAYYSVVPYRPTHAAHVCKPRFNISYDNTPLLPLCLDKSFRAAKLAETHFFFPKAATCWQSLKQKPGHQATIFAEDDFLGTDGSCVPERSDYRGPPNSEVGGFGHHGNCYVVFLQKKKQDKFVQIMSSTLDGGQPTDSAIRRILCVSCASLLVFVLFIRF